MVLLIKRFWSIFYIRFLSNNRIVPLITITFACNREHMYRYLVIDRDKSYFVKSYSKFNNK